MKSISKMMATLLVMTWLPIQKGNCQQVDTLLFSRNMTPPGNHSFPAMTADGGKADEDGDNSFPGDDPFYPGGGSQYSVEWEIKNRSSELFPGLGTTFSYFMGGYDSFDLGPDHSGALMGNSSNKTGYQWATRFTQGPWIFRESNNTETWFEALAQSVSWLVFVLPVSLRKQIFPDKLNNPIELRPDSPPLTTYGRKGGNKRRQKHSGTQQQTSGNNSRVHQNNQPTVTSVINGSGASASGGGAGGEPPPGPGENNKPPPTPRIVTPDEEQKQAPSMENELPPMTADEISENAKALTRTNGKHLVARPFSLLRYRNVVQKGQALTLEATAQDLLKDAPHNTPSLDITFENQPENEVYPESADQLTLEYTEREEKIIYEQREKLKPTQKEMTGTTEQAQGLFKLIQTYFTPAEAWQLLSPEEVENIAPGISIPLLHFLITEYAAREEVSAFLTWHEVILPYQLSPNHHLWRTLFLARHLVKTQRHKKIVNSQHDPLSLKTDESRIIMQKHIKSKINDQRYLTSIKLKDAINDDRDTLLIEFWHNFVDDNQEEVHNSLQRMFISADTTAGLTQWRPTLNLIYQMETGQEMPESLDNQSAPIHYLAFRYFPSGYSLTETQTMNTQSAIAQAIQLLSEERIEAAIDSLTTAVTMTAVPAPYPGNEFQILDAPYQAKRAVNNWVRYYFQDDSEILHTLKALLMKHCKSIDSDLAINIRSELQKHFNSPPSLCTSCKTAYINAQSIINESPYDQLNTLSNFITVSDIHKKCKQCAYTYESCSQTVIDGKPLIYFQPRGGVPALSPLWSAPLAEPEVFEDD